MNIDSLHIAPILRPLRSNGLRDSYAVCWVQDGVTGIKINKTMYENISNSIFFLNPEYEWTILKDQSATSSGYILHIPKSILNLPQFKNLHINQIRLLNPDEIPTLTLAPGIESRVKAILEMIDELLSTNLKHREEAIISLLSTFFIYCDGKCNIKSLISENNAKSALVYRFKKYIDRDLPHSHEVGSYASALNVSSKYLNECVKEVLGVNAKYLIDEQLVMRARHDLKFTDKTVKEIGYDLGFSSPDYFSYFFKKHTGTTPSGVRKN